ncbi:hypothetical protein T05_812 [Trichinella murrelli]|uniref:Uncharacterized protein n=1 Tax=Trichinella murrelli TaxID=144512 RepID=A0A0V0TJ67_9BILA|nr:hypothetical protein T05_812 [Trichinella murrelli]
MHHQTALTEKNRRVDCSKACNLPKRAVHVASIRANAPNCMEQTDRTMNINKSSNIPEQTSLLASGTKLSVIHKKAAVNLISPLRSACLSSIDE